MELPNLPHAAPATQNDSARSPNTPPAMKSDSPWSTNNLVLATKSDEFPYLVLYTIAFPTTTTATAFIATIGTSY